MPRRPLSRPPWCRCDPRPRPSRPSRLKRPRSKERWPNSPPSGTAYIAETTQLRAMAAEIPKLQAQYDELRTHVVETSDTAILQEVGVYEYRHPLTDAPAYKGQLATISDQIKTAVKSGPGP